MSVATVLVKRAARMRTLEKATVDAIYLSALLNSVADVLEKDLKRIQPSSCRLLGDAIAGAERLAAQAREQAKQLRDEQADAKAVLAERQTDDPRR